jgi:hypothetical protein
MFQLSKTKQDSLFYRLPGHADHHHIQLNMAHQPDGGPPTSAASGALGATITAAGRRGIH